MLLNNCYYKDVFDQILLQNSLVMILSLKYMEDTLCL